MFHSESKCQPVAGTGGKVRDHQKIGHPPSVDHKCLHRRVGNPSSTTVKLRIYLKQTDSDSGKTNQDSFGEIYFVHVLI